MSSGGPKIRLVVTAELPCRRCRHLLRGLAVDGLCPECGLSIDETLRSSIDLESLHGRAFTRPRTVATAILLLALATTLIVLGNLIVPLITVLARGSDAGGLEATVHGSGPLVDGMFFLMLTMSAAGLAAIAGLLSLLWSDARPLLDRLEGLRWLAMIIGASLLAWISGRFLRIEPETVRVGDLMNQLALVDLLVPSTAILSVVGLRRLLQRVGHRSNQYLRAHRGLQTAKPMIAGLVISVVLGLTWSFLVRSRDPIMSGGIHENLATIRLVLGGLLSIGGFYLMTNAIWATSPLRRRESNINQLVGPDSPASMADVRPPGDTA